MELRDIKSAFTTGGLSSLSISYTPLLAGYIVTVKTKSGREHPLTTQREGEGCPRSFKSVDSAIAAIKNVGFKQVTIDL